MVDLVAIPTVPGPRKATPRLVSGGTDLTGPINASTQRVLRLGTRFAVDYEYPQMTAAHAQVIVNRLVRADASPVAIAWPMRFYVASYPGALTVSASGATGGTLPIHGGTPNFLIQEGRVFHLSSGGRRYIHIVQQDTQLDATGAANLPINPLLRVQPATGDALEFVAPIIEGFVERQGVTWNVELASTTGIKFTVTEDR